MNEIKNKEQTAFVNDEDSYNKKTISRPVPERNIGIDVDGDFTKDVIEAGFEGTSSQLDISKIESFTTISQNRDLLYQTIDCMAEDPTIAAALETYAEDATEPNENGEIVWAESDDENVGKFVNFLLDSIGVNKNIYSWIYSLCKYGDLYLRLFRESDVKDPLFKDEKEKLNEDVKLKIYSKNDNYTHYVEKVPNPAEMFELVRFGKSYAYIKAPVSQTNNKAKGMFATNQFRYSFRKNDVELYPATEFAHACLEDDNSRQPEEVNIFLTDKDYEENTNALSYKVRRGQSLLYTVFKAWREVTLLTNALMLNRLTKSAITRIVQMEVGDMPKEDVQKQLYYIKSLLEQKTAINEGQSIQEYTNPGPMENCIYVPMRNQKGQITVSSVGGDSDVNTKGIADIDFFNDRLFTALRIPKQFMGFTSDNAGFSGGESLSIISSRYAKAVKKIQSAMINAITDTINLMLLDKQLPTYIGKFTIRMQPPITRTDIDKKDIVQGKVANIQDIMSLLEPIEDSVARLKILKSLISSIVTNPEVISIIQQEIDKMEENGEEEEDDNPKSVEPRSHPRMSREGPVREPRGEPELNELPQEEPIERQHEESGDEMILPTPLELDSERDFSDMSEG